MSYVQRIAGCLRRLRQRIDYSESMYRQYGAQSDSQSQAIAGELGWELMRLYDLECRLHNRLRGIPRPTR